MSRLVIVVAALLAMSGSAFASSCPRHMKSIDEALAKNPTLAAAELAEAKKLRAEGEELHKAGKHAESMTALGKAEAILKIK
ncbi:MAG: hypothetical protein KIT81_12095 [Alphaproteobacteria bacterium]|nr:hypothetical protein [Alphaproteobacteria bacterium]